MADLGHVAGLDDKSKINFFASNFCGNILCNKDDVNEIIRSLLSSDTPVLTTFVGKGRHINITWNIDPSNLSENVQVIGEYGEVKTIKEIKARALEHNIQMKITIKFLLYVQAVVITLSFSLLLIICILCYFYLLMYYGAI